MEIMYVTAMGNALSPNMRYIRGIPKYPEFITVEESSKAGFLSFKKAVSTKRDKR